MDAIRNCSILAASLVLLAATTQAQAAPNQLAYFVGHETIHYGYGTPPSGIYYKTKIYRVQGNPYPRVIWTRWKDVGYGCRSSCLIDRFSGQMITCRRACVW